MDGYGSAAASHIRLLYVTSSWPPSSAIRAILDVMDRWRTGEGALARRASVLANTRLWQRRRRKRQYELLADGCVWWHSTEKVEQLTNTEGRKKDQQFLYYAENHIVREKITAAIDQWCTSMQLVGRLLSEPSNPLVARGSLSLHYSFNFPTAPVKLQCHER